VVDRQTDSAVENSSGAPFDERADMKNGDATRRPGRTPGLAFVSGDHQVHGATRPAPTDTLTK